MNEHCENIFHLASITDQMCFIIADFVVRIAVSTSEQPMKRIKVDCTLKGKIDQKLYKNWFIIYIEIFGKTNKSNNNRHEYMFQTSTQNEINHVFNICRQVNDSQHHYHVLAIHFCIRMSVCLILYMYIISYNRLIALNLGTFRKTSLCKMTINYLKELAFSSHFTLLKVK